MVAKARYIMIGGFLGAGKTTAILRFAQWLRDTGKRVGLITNDQSIGLVDTTLLAAHGFDVEEITGGCFCCRFDSLLDASHRLSRKDRPDVFLAEPVGSCTDLRASVSHPLQRIYGDEFQVAPLSVLIDPVRALRVLEIEDGRKFSRKVLYVYEKQLEEAEVLVVNKSELLDAGRLARLQEALEVKNPRARQMVISAREGLGLTEWFEFLLGSELGNVAAPELDYERYAEGEALLGWLNGMADVSAPAPFDGNALLRTLAQRLQRGHEQAGLEIAHLKMTLTPSELATDLAVLNLVRNDGEAETSHELKEPLSRGELTVNLRVEGSPEQVRAQTEAAVREVAEQAGLTFTVRHLEHFAPAKPEPTHRMATP